MLSNSSTFSPSSCLYCTTISRFGTFITLYFFTFAFSFLLPHTTPISFIFVCNQFSLSAVSTASSANSKLLILPNIISLSFKQTPAFMILTIPSIHKINSYDDIIQPCFSPTSALKHLSSSLHTFRLTLRSDKMWMYNLMNLVTSVINY